jgi:hypothetical protein
VLVGAGGLVLACLAWLSARRSVRISEEYLAARERAERQPALEGSVRLEPSTRRSRRSKFGSLEVKVFNTGKIPRTLCPRGGERRPKGPRMVFLAPSGLAAFTCAGPSMASP